MIFLYILAPIIVLVVIYLALPFSKTKKQFKKFINLYANQDFEKDVFKESDIAHLPPLVKKYIRHCGYIGKPKMPYVIGKFKRVKFHTGISSPVITMDYTQYNFVKLPARFAYIDSSLFLLPFEGLDSFFDCKGRMKGVLAKNITLFDQIGDDMDKACLVTYLSEALIIPTVAIQDFITWQTVDQNRVRATMTYLGKTVSGIFTFNDDGEMVSFTTYDRVSIDFKGNVKRDQWSAFCLDYQVDGGILKPTHLKATWHYPEGDFTYFDGTNASFTYPK